MSCSIVKNVVSLLECDQVLLLKYVLVVEMEIAVIYVCNISMDSLPNKLTGNSAMSSSRVAASPLPMRTIPFHLMLPEEP